MKRFIYYLSVFSGVVLLCILALMTAEVVFRYAFNMPILGTVEISSYLLVIFGFTGMAYTQSQKGHIEIDLITQQLSSRANHVLRLVSLFLSLAAFAAITWQTASAFWTSWEIQEVRWGALPLPVWPVKFIVAFGSFILCIQFVMDIIEEFKRPGASRRQDAEAGAI